MARLPLGPVEALLLLRRGRARVEHRRRARGREAVEARADLRQGRGAPAVARERERVPLGLPLGVAAVDVEALVGRAKLALRVRVLVPPALRAGARAEDALLAGHGVKPLARRLDELLGRGRGALDRPLLPQRLAEGEVLRVLRLAVRLRHDRALAGRPLLGDDALPRLLRRLGRQVILEPRVVQAAPAAVDETIVVDDRLAPAEERVPRALLASAGVCRVPHLHRKTAVVLGRVEATQDGVHLLLRGLHEKPPAGRTRRRGGRGKDFARKGGEGVH